MSLNFTPIKQNVTKIISKTLSNCRLVYYISSVKLYFRPYMRSK